MQLLRNVQIAGISLVYFLKNRGKKAQFYQIKDELLYLQNTNFLLQLKKKVYVSRFYILQLPYLLFNGLFGSFPLPKSLN